MNTSFREPMCTAEYDNTMDLKLKLLGIKQTREENVKYPQKYSEIQDATSYNVKRR